MRSIRPQTVTLAVLAILFGLGAVWAAKQVLLSKQVVPVVAPAPAPLEPPVPLLVVQSNLVADARIREQDVGQTQNSLATLTAKNIPLEKALKFKQQAVGRILKTSKTAGSWLTEEDFYPLGQGPPLKLKEGYRAVTLRVDDPAVSSSIIRTGSLVDVLLTAENPDDGTKLTRRLVSALEVISPPVSDGGLPNSVTSVSGKSYIVLAATPAEADKLALAQQMGGTISVTLCAVPSTGDGTRLDSKQVDAMLSRGDHAVTERELLGLPPPTPPPAPPAPPERIVVEQIRGNKIDYVVFTDDNVRLTQEEARQDSLPQVAASGVAKPAKSGKRCKSCEEAAKKAAREKARRQGGSSTPTRGVTPDATPGPTPAPKENEPSPSPEPLPPKTT